MRLRHQLRSFRRLGSGDQVRFTAAWLLLGVSRLLIVLLPFRVIRRLLGQSRVKQVPTPPAELDELQRARAEYIGTVVGTAALHVPWRSDCYPQALTARTFLALRGIPHVVSFGVRREDGALTAHAWVHAGGVAVTGGDGSSYTEVGTFSWAPRRKRGG